MQYKGSECIDNLSSGSYYVALYTGTGQCHRLDSTAAKNSQTNLADPSDADHPRKGVVTKAFSGHPHNVFDLEVGMVGLKRVKCSGNTCHTFKTGYCIKCPRAIFHSKAEYAATQAEVNEFVSCCMMGENRYLNATGTETACHLAFEGGAFTAFNDPNAVLKGEYECDADAQAKFSATLKVA